MSVLRGVDHKERETGFEPASLHGWFDLTLDLPGDGAASIWSDNFNLVAMPLPVGLPRPITASSVCKQTVVVSRAGLEPALCRGGKSQAKVKTGLQIQSPRLCFQF